MGCQPEIQCAQDGCGPMEEIAGLQWLLFQADGAKIWKLVASCGTLRLSPATFLSTATQALRRDRFGTGRSLARRGPRRFALTKRSSRRWHNALPFRIRCEGAFAAKAPFDLDLRHDILFGDGVPQNRQIPPVEEVQNPIVDVAFPDPELVNAISEQVPTGLRNSWPNAARRSTAATQVSYVRRFVFRSLLSQSRTGTSPEGSR
jgi:hypothetical protein